jgi:UDP-N-acetylmuramoyl-tripeptide--D-alanyl-D-alanine ligase
MFAELLSFFWFFSVLRGILFWVYLWQLKEYHIGRFLAYFRTEKGKKSLLNAVSLIKFLLVLGFLGVWRFGHQTNPWLVFLFLAFVFFFYLFEFFRFFKALFLKELVKPVFTLKTLFLVFVCSLVSLAFIWLFFPFFMIEPVYPFLGILLFDLFTFVIVSFLVLVFQPFAVLSRNLIIGKAVKKRDSFKGLIAVGITGSFGKTSVKEFLASILSAKFRVLKTKEHQNSEIGIAQCILNDLKPEHQIFVAEMGAYGKGGVKLLAGIVKPRIGVLTGINQQHLATFGSQENIINAKFELIGSLPADGVAVLNGDNAFVSTLKPRLEKLNLKSKVFYSSKGKADIWAENVSVGRDFVSFKVFSSKGESAEIRAGVIGGHSVLNLLAAIAAASELGMSFSEISEAVKKIPGSSSGMVLKKNSLEMNIVDSSYSANPDGVLSDLEYLKAWTGKKAVVMPCLIELGSAAAEIHRKIGEKIAQVCDLAVITTKEMFEEIKKASVDRGMKPESIVFLEKPQEILEKVNDFKNENDIILLEGRMSKEILKFLIK